MIYRNNEIPSNYNKVAEISDNYIVWVKESRLQNDIDYDAYIQFFNPSFSYVHIGDYKIQKGDSFSIIPHYTNNGVYNYIDYYEYDFSLGTYELASGDDFTYNEYNRSDFIPIFIGQFIVVIIFVWILNKISLLWKKGGV